MENMKNSLNWFEIPVKDFDRARKFYSQIYEFEMPEQEMGPFKMGFFPVEQGGIGGAIVQGDGYQPSGQGSKVYLNGGDDLNTVLNRVETAGGKIVMPKTEITPEYGNYAMFEDTEGNVVCLHSMK